MNEETELTVVPDPEAGKRPAKKKPAEIEAKVQARSKKAPAKKKFAPGKSGSKTSAGKSASVKTAPKKKSVVKKAGSPSKTLGKSSKSGSPTNAVKTPKSEKTPKKTSSENAGEKPGKPVTPPKIKEKPPGEVIPSAGATTGRKPRTPAPLPEGLDVSTLKPWKNYGIARVNQPKKKNFGFYVRVRGPEGTADSRTEEFFSDKKNGGEAKALKAATARRNELFQFLPDALKYRASKPTKRKSKPAA